jgi:hypothetical protein
MKALSMSHAFLVLSAAMATMSAGTAAAQEPSKPGPEHTRLKEMEGTWEAEGKMTHDGSTFKGTQVSKLDLNGLWLVGEFTAEFGPEKFRGRSIDGYDPVKKKYVSVWVDSMSATPMISEGDFKDGKLVLVGTGPGHDGKPTKHTMTTEIKDKDTMLFTMAMAGPDGKDIVTMTIMYKRKK